MTKDEALKLALEKFEFMNHVDSIFEGEFNFQINAIKEALMSVPDGAQPEQSWTPERIAGMARLKEAQDKKLAQPEQKPMHPQLKAMLEEYFDKCFAESAPQRKPLSDEEIGYIAVKSQEGISPRDDTLRFARAIEAAHGIKGEV